MRPPVRAGELEVAAIAFGRIAPDTIPLALRPIGLGEDQLGKQVRT